MSSLHALLTTLKESLRRIWSLRRAVQFVWRSGPVWTVASAVLLVVQSILPLLMLYLIKLLIDGVTDGAAPRELLPLLAGACGVALLQTFATVASRFVGDTQAQAVTDTMYDILHAKSIEIDLAYYEDPRYRDSLHRVQQQAPYRPARVVSGLLELGRNAGSLLAMAGLLFALHWAVVPVLIACSLPGVYLRLRHAERLYQWQRARTPAERLTYYYNQLLTSARFVKEIRLSDLGSYFQRKFFEGRGKLRRERLRLTTKRSIGEACGEALAVIGMFLILGFMGYRTLAGIITLGSLVMYYQALQKAWGYLGQVLRSVTNLYEDNLFLAEVYEFLDLEPEVIDPPHPKPVPQPIARGIALEAVSFRYPAASTDALEEITFSIAPGEHVAIVGPNGSGKTTLIKLLCRLYDPREGAIRIDGIDLREFACRDLRREFGVFLQDFTRYQQTARENVLQGSVDLGASEEEITQAARASTAEEFVAALPRGYQQVLGNTFDGSKELSVGQWQKLAMARVFVREAQIYILDEPTSYMDAQSEQAVLGRFLERAKGRTVVLISHRPSVLELVERIVVLDHGRVVGIGTHTELMERNSRYAQLFRKHGASA